MDTTALFGTGHQKRLVEMDKLLRTADGMTREQICLKLAAKGLRVSQRNFFRDITTLKNMKAPVTRQDRFCEATGRTQPHWFYNKAYVMGGFKLSPNDIIALSVARDVVEKHAGLPLSADFQKIFKMLTELQAQPMVVHYNNMVPLCFSPDSRPIEAHIWKELLRATLEKQRLQMRYQKGWGKGQPVEDLLVEPYRIAIMGGTWYLLAMDFNKHNQVLHQYKILNIREAKMTNEVFTPARGVDVQKILDNTFGQFIGDPNNLTKVRIRFSQRAAPLFMGRKFQANEQRTYIKEEERTEITLTVARGTNLPYYHILSWILSWGGDAEVMEPADLRQAVTNEAKRIAAIYKKTSVKK